jgi:hypothetical protein
MVRGVVLFAIVAACLAAPAAGATDPRVPGLQRQIKTLTRLVNQQSAVINQQTAAITKLQGDLSQNIAYDLCSNAIYFDLFHGITKTTSALSGLPVPTFTPVDDQGNCAKIGVVRTPQSAGPGWLYALNRATWAFTRYAAFVAAR